MTAIRWLETDTLSNQNISSALAIGAYTAAADRLIMAQAFVDQAAGNGDYVMYCTLQIGGAGSIYVILPKTTMTAAAGETAIAGQSGWINVRNGDIVTVYVDGLAGDTTTPDTIVRWFEDAALQPTTADTTLDIAATGEAGIDFNNVKAATAPTTLTNITVPTVTTVGSATLAATQPAITWAQQKIVANVANEGALDIRNANADGHGTLNDGGEVGLYSSGGTYGQYNAGTASHGVVNTGGAYGQYNGGGDSGVYNSGVNYGVKSDGGTAGQYNLGNGGMGYGQQNVGDAIGQYNVGSGAGSAGQTNEGVAQGQHNDGATGQQNDGGAVGQYNAGTTYGAQNTGASGLVNVGTAGDGLYASGTDYGIQAVGVTGDTDPDWSGGGGLTAQQTRDAMTLAPTPGAPAAGSVDAHLDTLITGVNVTSIANDAITNNALATSAVNEIVDQVWDEAIAGHLAVGSTGAALNGAGGGATVFPTGAINFTYTVTDSVTLLPIEGVEVWFSTDNPPVNIVWKGDTDAFGVARDVLGNLPALDVGIYFVSCQKAGYTFVIDTEVVS